MPMSQFGRPMLWGAFIIHPECRIYRGPPPPFVERSWRLWPAIARIWIYPRVGICVACSLLVVPDSRDSRQLESEVKWLIQCPPFAMWFLKWLDIARYKPLTLIQIRQQSTRLVFTLLWNHYMFDGLRFRTRREQMYPSAEIQNLV